MAGPRSPQHQAFGRALRALRHEAGLTLEDLGGRVPAGGMNPNYISAVERGEINVSFSNLVRLSEGLGVEPSEMMRAYERVRDRA